MTSVLCPICSSKDSSMYMTEVKDILYKCKGEWDLVRCSSCNVIYTSPPLKNEELNQYYPSTYSSYNVVNKKRNIFARLVRNILMFPYIIRFGFPDRRVRPYGQKKLLEIGCGSGVYLYSMSSLGWKCWGIDISVNAIEKSKTLVPSAHIEQTFLENFETDELFTMVSISHVLEHIPEPVAAIRRIYKLLEPGGIIEIEVPNIGSFEAKLFGRKWKGLDVPRHITHFTSETITKILRSNGFSEIAIKPAMFSSSISESLTLSFPEKYINKIMNSSLSRMLYYACIFPASLSYFFGNKGVISVRARKPA